MLQADANLSEDMSRYTLILMKKVQEVSTLVSQLANRKPVSPSRNPSSVAGTYDILLRRQYGHMR
jgi:hypothetical protein